MIVPMKKVTIIVQAKDALDTVKVLRSLGVVHVEHQQPPKHKSISILKEDITLIDKVVGILSAEVSTKPSAEQVKELIDWKKTAQHISDSYKRKEQLSEYAAMLRNSIIQWQNWGDFDPAKIISLREKNITIRFYQIPLKEMKRLPESVIVKQLFISSGIANCALISPGEINIPFKEIPLPKYGLSQMRARLTETENTIRDIKDEFKMAAGYVKSFHKTRELLAKERKFYEALYGMAGDGGIVYLCGYVPEDKTAALLKTSRREKWATVIKTPREEDYVPTLIRHNRFTTLISPVFKLIEIVPGYRELDASFLFLIFFSIFFGVLIGDAGYGLVYFILTIIVHACLGRKLKNNALFILFYVLSTCTIIWGVLNGTFFGQEWITKIFPPILPALRDSNNIQRLCFLIGAIHLSIAHLWRALIKMPQVSALADAGWIVILAGAFFLAKALVLGDALPDFVKWLFISGAVLVVFFTSPGRNILKTISRGAGRLLLNLVNSFTDVVSYVRLFAVGLATVAVADAFNNMAQGIGYNSLLSGIIFSLILFAGHGLNIIILGPLSILVHGVRLNILEFSANHLDVTWSGIPYMPLRKSMTNDK